MIPWWQTSFDHGEDVAVSDAINSRHISQGTITKNFEILLAGYLGVPEVIATSSGTSALTLALIASNIGPGDEVLVPNNSWIASGHAVQILGATPVFVDTEADLPIMQLSKLDRLITPATKAIMPVHMNGRSVDMAALNDFASDKGLVVIEDSSQAVGSKDVNGKFLASIGIVQLRLMEQRKYHLSKVYQHYYDGLSSQSNLRIIPKKSYELGPYVDVLTPNRDALRKHLSKYGIETRPFYPELNSAPYWQARNTEILNNSKLFSNSGLYLPSGPAITESQIGEVTFAINKFAH